MVQKPYNMVGRMWRKAIRTYRLKRDPIGYARSLGVKIGEGCKIVIDAAMFGTEPYLVKIGNHVEITQDVRFVTHDGAVWIFRQKYPTIDLVAPIIVGNNCFIGTGAVILKGVRIGDNCVIGAHAVVTRDIPSNSVALGIPAHVTKSIDEYWESIREKTLPTHMMTSMDKRAYLINRFRDTLCD